MHGYGKFYFQDYRIYEGEFYRGRLEGVGIMKYPDGRIYEGEFKRGLRDGYGSYQWEKNVYTGWWYENK